MSNLSNSHFFRLIERVLGKMNSNNIQVVFLGNYWPYVDGGTRIARIASVLAKRGYQVHIFTMPLHTAPPVVNGITVHEVRFDGDIFRWYRKILRRMYGINSTRQHTGLKAQIISGKRNTGDFQRKFLQKLFTFYESLFGYPDAYKGWQKELFRSVDMFISQQKRQCILISEHPVISHIVAQRIKAKHGVCWISDFVDLWSENHNYPYGSIRRFFDRRLEIKTLRSSDSIITTSSLWAEKLKSLHNPHKVTAIPHGYDNEIYDDYDSKCVYKNADPRQEGKQVKILYAGRVYGEMQDVTIFFDALRKVQSNFDDLCIDVTFYTPDGLLVTEAAKLRNVEHLVTVHNTVPRSKILEIMPTFDLTLALGVNTGGGLTGSVPSKIYDYIAMRRPILLVGGVPGDASDLIINETGVGISAFSRVECARALEKYILDIKDEKIFSDHWDKDKLYKYSNDHSVDLFEDCIRKLNPN